MRVSYKVKNFKHNQTIFPGFLKDLQYSSHIHFSHLIISPPSFFLLLSSFAGLGGCIRGLTIRSNETNPPVSRSVNLSVASRRSVRVYLDGCPTSESRFNCRGNDSVLVYSGRRTEATDYSLQPFTGNNAQLKYTTTQTQTPKYFNI